MKGRQHFITILILGSLTTVSPFSIDMYLPAFPSIAADLHTNVAEIQLSLTSYFIGISIGQLIYGPLLDRFGRKAPLYGGMVIYILASLGCTLIHSAQALLIMRFVQAIGGCVGLVASRALVRDIFPASEIAKIFSTLMLVLAVSPMLAPTVGGYVATAFNWRIIFIILASIATIILLAAHFFLPQGKKADPTLSLRPQHITKNFFIVLKHPQFITYAVAGSLASAITYAYIAGAPDVFISIYKVPERMFGWLFAFIAAGIIGCSQLNRILLKYWKSEQLIIAGLTWQFAIAAILVVGTINSWFGLSSYIILVFLLMCGQGLTVPNSSALSITPFVRHAGSASALLGAMQLAFGSVVSALVSFFHNGTAMPMIMVTTACVVLSLLTIGITHQFLAREAKLRVVEEETAKPLI